MMLRIEDTSVPVVILNAKLAALGIMRSLGPLGVKVYALDSDRKAPAFKSKYCSGAYTVKGSGDRPDYCLSLLREIAADTGTRPILIPTSDETAEFVAENSAELSDHYLFPENSPAVIKGLASKKEMFYLAKKYNVPVPETEFPQCLEDVEAYAMRASFPVMLKGIYGNRLMLRTGHKMYIAKDRDRLIEQYRLLEEPGRPNLMLQEYIPGEDDQIYIFNGYFNKDSECLVSFTGHKIRQFPIHTGCASLGICAWNSVVTEQTTNLMKKIGYRGILDIGYRYDPRDWRFKVLDINPRIGQAFRLFLADNELDVARAMYLDLTGQEVPQAVQREGRRWLIEDYDIISAYHYYREGGFSLFEWLRSLKGVEETAWFSASDPRPFLSVINTLAKKTVRWSLKKTRRALSL